MFIFGFAREMFPLQNLRDWLQEYKMEVAVFKCWVLRALQQQRLQDTGMTQMQGNAEMQEVLT